MMTSVAEEKKEKRLAEENENPPKLQEWVLTFSSVLNINQHSFVMFFVNIFYFESSPL